LNGGPKGIPSNGVRIENVMFRNVTGSMMGKGRNYYVLCGEGSCSNVTFENVNITGGEKESMCNFPVGGCPT
jgi:polygalacturonase